MNIFLNCEESEHSKMKKFEVIHRRLTFTSLLKDLKLILFSVFIIFLEKKLREKYL